MTIETLQRLRRLAGMSKNVFSSKLEPKVLRWALAAGRSERRVAELHRNIAAGARTTLPWTDNVSDKPPYAHQEVMASVASELDGVGFICDMGTGKTRAAIEAMGEWVRRGDVEFCLVVCPKTVMPVWRREIDRWSDTLTTALLQGSVAVRRDLLRREEHFRPGTVFVLNYEATWRLDATISKLFKDRKCALILDEGHKIRNPRSKQSKACIGFARGARRNLLLTGTPIIQGAHDIWSQWYVIDLGVTFGANFAQFKREFFRDNPWTHKLDPIGNALQEINDRIARRGLRYKKVDCLDLPPKVFNRIEIPMTAEQDDAYHAMAEDLIAWLADRGSDGTERVATAATALTALLRLTQITSGFLPTEDGEIYRFPESPKMGALRELVNEQITTQQIIVWAWYNHDVETILDEFREHDPVHIYGKTSAAQREAAEDAFQSGATRLLVGNPASAGLGLNLQAASMAIYYSQGYSLEHRLQSEDRCHRSGSEIHDTVTYVDLCAVRANGGGVTIDASVSAALAQKLTVAEAVTEFRSIL